MIPDTRNSLILPLASMKFAKMQLNMTIDILRKLWLARGGVFCSIEILTLSGMCGHPGHKISLLLTEIKMCLNKSV